MPQLTTAAAVQALQLHSQRPALTPESIAQLLGSASVTFAQLLYVTRVQLAARYRALEINKVTSANVQLASNILAHTQLFTRAVRRSAARHSSNDPVAVENFSSQPNYYEHTSCYSVVQHRPYPEQLYLYAIYTRASSLYLLDGQQLTRTEVAKYMTASAAALLLDPLPIVNKTHNIRHDVCVRTIALSNILEIRARHQLLRV